MEQRRVENDGIDLVVRDFGGPGPTLLALHGHFGHGGIFAPLAAALAGRYRVVAPDLRSHGLSAHGGALTPDAYAADAAAVIEALGGGPVAVLGHSMGGAVAFLLAAGRPDLVSALVVVDMTVLNVEPETYPILDVSDWPRRVPSREALREAVEARGVPDASYFMDSAAEFDDGWGFLFDTGELMESQRALVGDHSEAWRASAGGGRPALLMRGGDTFMLSEATAERMVAERPGTTLVEVPGCGHWLYSDAPDTFAEEVGDFLERHPW
ncbi:alpha/beta fold hydrolase [Actinomadura harenae]|uniref:Alpha/beta hydrolase n=1 Tax=Actinomadura harenae TaxID=2483351 RepID=A0A3M2LMA9_9ACTN|nr:alpha/beta hydrolase [Actinomadura harenae]RMI38577.1 alpha/beta hydrolase [Actinomadura harenae]